MKRLLGFCLVGLMAFAGAAQAVLLEGVFSGTVYNSLDSTRYDGTTLFGGAAYGGQNGETITGTLRIETDLAPADGYPSPYYGYYNSYHDTSRWLDISMTLNGVTMSLDGSYRQLAWLYPHYGQYGVHARDLSYTRSNAGQVYTNHYGTIYFYDHLLDILNGDGLEQTFSFTSNQPGQYGYGTYFLYDHTYINGVGFTDVNYAYGSFYLDELTLSYASVSEPASIALLGAGLLGLGFTRRLRST